ncbi:MAG: serine/threonine protein kinase [Planctomycetes bacterium]|nr:serine/threonine protein kinase [Planctomycetota bacterium]
MSEEARPRLEEIFHRASELPPAERPHYLQVACAGDAAARMEVESLLAALDDAGEFMASPVPPPSATGRDEERGAAFAKRMIGARVGAYEIIRYINEGGMGCVFEARRQSPQRTVAIKIMKGDALSSSAARRFSYESEILARLRHANIAHVYDAGLYNIGAADIPWFAMEFLEGASPITHFAENARLGLRDKIQLFLQCLDAIRHGHQKGIIHLDLKPSNILVDSAGNVKVIDFGIAKAIETEGANPTLSAPSARPAGTIAYMSPEQCEGGAGAVDVRGDTYSLGVVLYQLLCGALPYDISTRSWLGAARVIHDAEPRAPRAVRPEIQDDLEAILLKALEKNPANRYQSAAEFGRDLRRFINNEPVEARTPGRAYRLKKFIIRNKAVSALGAILLSALLALVAVLSLLYVESERRRSEMTARQGEKTQYDQALRTLLYTIFGQAEPLELGKPQLLTDAVQTTLRAKIRMMADPRARAELLYFLGFVLTRQKSFESAIRAYEDAIAENSPEFKNSPQYSWCVTYLTDAYHEIGNNEQTRKYARLALRETRTFPNMQVSMHSMISEACVRDRDWEGASAAYDAIVGIYERIAIDPQFNDNIYHFLLHSGILLKVMGRFEESEKRFLRFKEILDGLPEFDLNRTVAIDNALASLYYRWGRPREGVRLLKEALDLLGGIDNIAGENLSFINNYALLLGAAGETKESLALFDLNIPREIAAFGDSHVRVGQACLDRATIRFQSGDADGAERDALAARDIYDRTEGPDRAEFMGAILHLLGRIRFSKARLSEAERDYRAAIEEYLRWAPDINFQIAEVQQSLGECLAVSGRAPEAGKLLTASLPPIEAAYGPDHYKTVEARARTTKYR